MGVKLDSLNIFALMQIGSLTMTPKETRLGLMLPTLRRGSGLDKSRSRGKIHSNAGSQSSGSAGGEMTELEYQRKRNDLLGKEINLRRGYQALEQAILARLENDWQYAHSRIEELEQLSTPTTTTGDSR